MADKKTRRYAASAARASQGYRAGRTNSRIVSTRTKNNKVVHKRVTKKEPAAVRDTRSELDRWGDARSAMGRGRRGDGRVYTDMASRAVRKRASSVGRRVRKATTGSAGKGSARKNSSFISDPRGR